MTFVNQFDSSIYYLSTSDQNSYFNAINSAEQFLQNTFTNNCTITLTFVADPNLGSGVMANNSATGFVACSYSDLVSHLPSTDILPAYTPVAGATNSTADWYLPESYARMLGLSSYTYGTDDTVRLNTSTWGWQDGTTPMNTLIHEISEGAMGRIGSLGVALQDYWGNTGYWGATDLFRFDSHGRHNYDYSNGNTYFSADGGTTIDQSLPFFSYGNGDLADFTPLDVFGTGYGGEAFSFSQTDLEFMQVLGWTVRDDTVSEKVPGSITTMAGQSFSFTGDNAVKVADDAVGIETFTTYVSDVYGTLSANGPGVQGSGTSFLTITGSLSSVNDALATLSYSNATAGADNIWVYTFDTDQSYASQYISVTTNAPSALVSMSPTANATDVAVGANLVLNFDETMQAGTGNIVIHNADGTTLYTIAATDTSQVTISGSTVTVNPAHDLAAGSTYYVTVDDGAFIDLASVAFTGISSSTQFTFATGMHSGINYGTSGNDVIDAGSGNNTIVEAFGNNTITAGDGSNSIVAYSGNNTITVGNGGDYVVGGTGSDAITGGTGNDILIGDISNAFFGNDTIDGGAGNDLVSGGSGADTFVFHTADGNDTIAHIAVDYVTPASSTPDGVDFQVGIDHIELVGFGYASANEALAHLTTDTQGNAVFSDQGAQIIFYEVSVADLTASSFILG